MTQKRKNVLIVGAFGYHNNSLDGQSIKTRNVYNLVKENSNDHLEFFCTSHAKSQPYRIVKLLWQLFKADKVILIPCRNNITYTFPLIYLIGLIVRYDVIHICIGSYHKNYFCGLNGLKAHPLQLWLSKKILAFLPETKSVNECLINELGFKNTEIFPNFRPIPSIPNPIYNKEDSLKLVFMARVQKMKGYDIIFEFAKYAEDNGLNITIDFYGQIESEESTEFMQKVKMNSKTEYKGYLEPEQITQTLCNYDVLLLPTRYYMEGFPGTILDAYIAGIPVIVTEWINSHEFVINGKTGFIVDFENPQDQFNQCIVNLYNARELLFNLKQQARKECFKYSEQSAWSILSKYLQ